MTPGTARIIALLGLAALLLAPSSAYSQAEIIELYCPSCGYREQFIQGSAPGDLGRNVQHIIVVCERNSQIRNIRIALDPELPVKDEPLLARQYGFGRSELLGMKLPRFLVPGNTCPLYPVSAYVERNVCPLDGSPGLHVAVVGRY